MSIKKAVLAIALLFVIGAQAATSWYDYYFISEVRYLSDRVQFVLDRNLKVCENCGGNSNVLYLMNGTNDQLLGILLMAYAKGASININYVGGDGPDGGNLATIPGIAPRIYIK